MAKRFFRIALIASATLLPLSVVGTGVTSLGWGTLVRIRFAVLGYLCALGLYLRRWDDDVRNLILP